MKNTSSVRAMAQPKSSVGVSAPLESVPNKPARRPRLKPVKFPRFEDVTPAEARAISKGAPPSGRFQREHGYSLTGNAAALCELETK
jgi:hypothetical protein